jgi:hypothetical protein
VETGHGRDGGTPADERAGQQGKTNFDLNHRATPRLYSNLGGTLNGQTKEIFEKNPKMTTKNDISRVYSGYYI